MARPKHSVATETTDPPLVDATTPNLYRDEAFWQFHYPDPEARALAQAEYELVNIDLNDDETFQAWLNS
jgi:hypothetical protein